VVALMIVCVLLVAVIVLIFFVVNKVDPHLFKISVTVSKWISLAIEIRRRSLALCRYNLALGIARGLGNHPHCAQRWRHRDSVPRGCLTFKRHR
jgi:hypothetical protein